MLIKTKTIKSKTMKAQVLLLASMTVWVIPMYFLLEAYPQQTITIVMITLFCIILSCIIICQFNLKLVSEIHQEYEDQLKSMTATELMTLFVQNKNYYLVSEIVSNIVINNSNWDNLSITTTNTDLVKKIPTLKVIDIKNYNGELSKSEYKSIEAGFLNLFVSQVMKMKSDQTINQILN